MKEPNMMVWMDAPWLKMRPTIFQLKKEYVKYLSQFRQINKESLRKWNNEGLALRRYDTEGFYPLEFGQWALSKADHNELMNHARLNKLMNRRKIQNHLTILLPDFLEAGLMAKKENELAKEADEKYLDEKIMREKALAAHYQISPFDDEAAQNDQFHPPKEEVSINVDIKELPSIWKRIKGWFA